MLPYNKSHTVRSFWDFAVWLLSFSALYKIGILAFSTKGGCWIPVSSGMALFRTGTPAAAYMDAPPGSNPSRSQSQRVAYVYAKEKQQR